MLEREADHGSEWDREVEHGKPEVEPDQQIEAAPMSEGERLQMLGYDAVLGRPLGFWSASAMNFCHLSFQWEWIVYIAMYSYNGPLIFIIGYPIAAIINIIMLGPFCEMVSAFPVAGAMASWSWQCARKGIRHERQWGYLMGGVVLAMHVGKVIFLFYSVTQSMVTMYVFYSGIPIGIDGDAIHPKAWWHPVFYLVLVTFVAIIVMCRLGRNGTFWIAVALFEIGILIMVVTVYILCAVKTAHLPRNFDFPRKSWTHDYSWMIFVGLPLRIPSIDCAAHMAEETRNPSRTVPRAMYFSTIVHHCIVYVLVLMFILFVMPFAHGIIAAMPSALRAPIIPVGMILNLNRPTTLAFAILSFLSAVTYVIAAMTVSTRFLFALARDNGIPFAKLLAKTDKNKEPWVAALVLVAVTYLSTLGWLMNTARYYNLLLTTSFLLINVAYVIPLFLYVTTDINFRQVERSEFSLRGWGKPSAYLSMVFLVLSFIQGCMPISSWTNVVAPVLKVDTISALPMVTAGIFLVIFIFWWLYGRTHYIGPIRSITKWTAGIEIDPNQLDTSGTKHSALNAFINKRASNKPPAGRSPGLSSLGSTNMPRDFISDSTSRTSETAASPTLRRLFFPRSRKDTGVSQEGPIREEHDGKPHIFVTGPASGEPHAMSSTLEYDDPAQQESQLLPSEPYGRSRGSSQAEPDFTSSGAPNKPRKSRGLLSRIAFKTLDEHDDESINMTHLPQNRGQPPAQLPLPEDQTVHSVFSRPLFELGALNGSQNGSRVGIGSAIEPAAMQESQLEPAGLESQLEPAAMQESQLEHRW